MKFLIIGLGIYGENLARDLVDLGHEVIGADINPVTVESVKNSLSTVYLVDSTEEAQLAVLPLGNVDLVIVAIGENFGASIKTVALLKKMGVKHIYARAIDPLHKAILENCDIDRIVTPEQRAANDLSYELELGSAVVTMQVGNDNLVVNFTLPSVYVGLKYSEVEERMASTGIKLVAACRPLERKNILGVKRPELTLLEDKDEISQVYDVVTVFGSRHRMRDFCRKLQ